jgi:hypothetical protein
MFHQYYRNVTLVLRFPLWTYQGVAGGSRWCGTSFYREKTRPAWAERAREERFGEASSYAFANLDILALHTEQEPRILGLPFFIHT